MFLICLQFWVASYRYALSKLGIPVAGTFFFFFFRELLSWFHDFSLLQKHEDAKYWLIWEWLETKFKNRNKNLLRRIPQTHLNYPFLCFCYIKITRKKPLSHLERNIQKKKINFWKESYQPYERKLLQHLFHILESFSLANSVPKHSLCSV